MFPGNRGGGFGRFSIFPPVLKTLLIVNISVFVLQFLFLEAFTINGVSMGRYMFRYFALQPISGEFNFLGMGGFYIWQLITYQFLHGDFWHIALNMFVLWMFGSELENLWGSRRFLYYYLLAGIGAGLVQLFISPLLGAGGPTVGASGAIYGLLLAFGMTFPNRPIFMFPFFIPIPAKFFVIIFAGIELMSGLMGSDGVAHFAHLGGAATGLLLLKFGDQIGIYKFLDDIFAKGKGGGDRVYSYQEPNQDKGNIFEINWAKKKEDYGEKSESPYSTQQTSSKTVSVDGEEITQAKIDEILDKISVSGYQNLSEKEKKILFELSKKL